MPRRVPTPRPQQRPAPREGDMVVSRTEFLVAAEIPAKGTEITLATSLLPTAARLPWLHRIGACFDEAVWESVEIQWRPCVAATFSGSLLLGVDWNSAAVAADRNRVAACSLSLHTPLWKPATVRLPQQRLQGRRAYAFRSQVAEENSPCAILMNVRGVTTDAGVCVGDVWVKYVIRLSGPRLA